jgi:pyruvate dehydrogenase E1 component alpha subunit
MRKGPFFTSVRRAYDLESLPVDSSGREGVVSELQPRQILDMEGNCDEHAEPKLTTEELQSLYRAMLRVRIMDTKAMNLHRQGRIGFYVPSFGEEAAQVGSAFALAPHDWIFPAYREQGAALLRGYPLKKLACQFFGNSGDDIKGRQMPNHYGTPAVNFASASSPVGTQIVQAVGASYACRLRGDDAVTLVYFGDGATSSPDFHTGMNFAAVWKTATVFFCKNNGYAISLPVARQTGTATLAEKAYAYGFSGVRVDGNDLLAVYQATKEAVERARGVSDSAPGPTLIEAVTFRMGPHSSADDPTRYRDSSVEAEWQGRDPIRRFRRYLDHKGIWSDAQDEETRKELEAEVNAAFRWAEKLPPPELETLVEDVYAEVPWHLREQLEEVKATRQL